MMRIPRAQEIYRHFKGNLYQIVTVAEHTETEEQLVIYQAMYGDFKVYARPLQMFCSKVDREKYPQVKQEYRFELQQVWCDKVESTEKSMPEAVKITTNQEEITEPIESEGNQDVEEQQLDPMLLEFLDADDYTQRLNILSGMHHRITDDMVTTMAIACDVEVDEGDLETRYQSLKNCLITLEKYEINRAW